MGIDLNNTELKSAIRIMMAESNVSSFAQLAEKIDKKETTLRSAINNKSLKVTSLIEISQKMGYTVVIEKEE